MDGDQLFDTTMDPNNRVLIQIRVEDAEKADAIFNKLMGSEVELRKTLFRHTLNLLRTWIYRYGRQY